MNVLKVIAKVNQHLGSECLPKATQMIRVSNLFRNDALVTCMTEIFGELISSSVRNSSRVSCETVKA